MLDALDTKKGVPLLKKKKFFKKNLYYLRLIITFWLILWRSDQDGVICKERKMKVIEIIKTIIMNSSPFSHNLWQYSFHNKFITPWTSMFSDDTFREMLFLSSGNADDYMVHVYSKYADLYGNNRTCRPAWKEVVQCD